MMMQGKVRLDFRTKRRLLVVRVLPHFAGPRRVRISGDPTCPAAAHTGQLHSRCHSARDRVHRDDAGGLAMGTGPACRYQVVAKTAAFLNASQRLSADWSQCPADAADGAACCEHFVAHAGGFWWHFQECVAVLAGNNLPSSRGAAHAEVHLAVGETVSFAGALSPSLLKTPAIGRGGCSKITVSPMAKVQFPEPIPGMSGLWSLWRWCGANPPPATGGARVGSSGRGRLVGDAPGSACSNQLPMIATNMADKVQVPPDLKPGQYLLSWRWDCEQTNQIWQNCADVQIVA